MIQIQSASAFLIIAVVINMPKEPIIGGVENRIDNTGELILTLRNFNYKNMK